MLAPMLSAFPSHPVQRNGVTLHTRIGGEGPPLLLIHGHPQSMAMWHRVAPELSRHFTLVLMDLRGYGDSSRPSADAAHLNYSKREMALDAMAVMAHHGFERFDVLAHDRGARVAHRLAADHPGAVRRLMLLDIAPTLAMYQQTGDAFARAYWHWFFLIQPPPLPEALIDSNPARYVRLTRWLWPNTSAALLDPVRPLPFARTTAPALRSTSSTTVRTSPQTAACRSRCACSGASTAPLPGASMCCRSGASVLRA